jgi:hypothetical protein
MQRSIRSVLAAASTLAVTGALLVGAPTAAVAADTGPVVVVRGLNNPRQIDLTALGTLLVAEAGRGGDQCVEAPGGETSTITCLGYTGSVSWVALPSVTKNSSPVRIVTGLLSGANQQGASATGSQAVSARTIDEVFIGVVDKPHGVVMPTGFDTTNYGKLLRSRWFGTPRIAADVAAYELAHDPDGQLYESNPYAVLSLPGRVLVADAAGNSVLQYRNGQLSTFKVLPNLLEGTCAGLPNENGTVGCDPVPTGLAVDRHGDIYVSGLGNLRPGNGRIWKLDGRTGAILKTWDGLTGVSGVAVDRNGVIFASQVFAGKVTRINPDGSRSDIAVPFPAGLAVTGSTLYVAAYSTASENGLGMPDVDSSGQVWRLKI